MMEINQAVSIVKQGLDVAVANGAFKSAKDVAVVNAATEAVSKYVEDHEASKRTEEKPALEKTKK